MLFSMESIPVYLLHKHILREITRPQNPLSKSQSLKAQTQINTPEQPYTETVNFKA